MITTQRRNRHVTRNSSFFKDMTHTIATSDPDVDDDSDDPPDGADELFHQ